MASNLVVQAGITKANAKSYAYDNTSYIQPDPINASIAAAGSSNTKFTSFTAKQLRSISVVASAAPTANDQLSLSYVSLAAQVFGTATGVSYVPAGESQAQGTNTATSSNTVTIVGVGNGLASPQTFPLGTIPAYNPVYFNLAGGTYTVVVANGSGTNTQTGFVFPTGPQGGISLNPGDVVTLAKGTDTVGAYQVEFELTFTPGTNFTL